MSKSEVDVLNESIQNRWPHKPSPKAQRYIGEFFEPRRSGTKITAKVVGNHGTYTVSIQVDEQQLSSACSCYIGKHGFCHHCEALARTFLNDISIFKEVEQKQLEEVSSLIELYGYLQGITLETLIVELKAAGITQKAFAEAIGMSSRHLSAIKSSEKRLSQTSKLLFLQNLRAIKNQKNLSAMILAGVAAARNINIVI